MLKSIPDLPLQKPTNLLCFADMITTTVGLIPCMMSLQLIVHFARKWYRLYGIPRLTPDKCNSHSAPKGLGLALSAKCWMSRFEQNGLMLLGTPLDARC